MPDAPASDRPRRTARRLPAAERRERVLAAALRLFAERGYQASMGDVAEAAGITRTVLYHYFPSKQRLFLAVLEAQASELVRHIALVVAGEGTQEERAYDVVDALLRFVAERPDAWALLFDHDLANEPEVAGARASIHERVMASMGVLFASDLTAAGLDAQSTAIVIAGEGSLGAAVAVARWWRAHPDVPHEMVADALFGLLWHGAGGLPAE